MARRKNNVPQKQGKNQGRQRIRVLLASGKAKMMWRDEYTGDK